MTGLTLEKYYLNKNINWTNYDFTLWSSDLIAQIIFTRIRCDNYVQKYARATPEEVFFPGLQDDHFQRRKNNTYTWGKVSEPDLLHPDRLPVTYLLLLIPLKFFFKGQVIKHLLHRPWELEWTVVGRDGDARSSGPSLCFLNITFLWLKMGASRHEITNNREKEKFSFMDWLVSAIFSDFKWSTYDWVNLGRCF